MKTKILLLAAICNITICNLQSNAQSIAAGGEHSLYLCNSQTPESVGDNAYGQLGVGDTTDRNIPVQISSLSGITAIGIGYGHSLFLKNDGTVWACGGNTLGQLGDGTTTSRNIPVQISGLSGIIAIAGGNGHSLFLKNDGTVWACGWNTRGQLGDGTATLFRNTPVQVSGLNGITALAGGEDHSLFLKNDGTVWACGDNAVGQLGDGTNTTRTTAVQLSGLSGITAVAGGYDHSLFLKNDGTVWACGVNNYGQLGDGTTTDRNTPMQIIGLSGIIAVAGGNGYSLFLKNDGTVWACGVNNYGQLGDGTTTNRNTPVQVNGLSGIIAVAGGVYHSLFIKNDSTVRACGRNNYGQLGDGTTTDRNIPVQVSGLCAIGVCPAVTFSQSPVICSGDSITVGSSIYTTSGTYTDTLFSATFNGCDSIVTTNLTVNSTYAITMNDTICNGDSIRVGNNIYKITGTYIDTLIASNTCDSIITTNLIVDTCTGISELQIADYKLQIAPNPFSHQTEISYSLNKLSQVKIELYNLLGQKIKTIADEKQGGGEHQYLLAFEKESSEIYFLKIKINDAILMKKIISIQ